MKQIKWLVLAGIVALATISVQAQDKKVEFGVSAGYGYTMPRIKDSRTDAEKLASPHGINRDNLHGFHVGPMVKFNFSEQVGFQTGVLFNYFSGMQNNEVSLKKTFGTWKQYRTVYSAFDMPLRVIYTMPLADELSVLLFAGPNLNYSLSKITTTEFFVSNKLQREEKGTNIYQQPSSFSALDLQMGAGLGLKYYGFSVRAGYDWGILNRTTLDNISLRSNDIKVTVGYTF